MQLRDVHICNHFQVCQLPSQLSMWSITIYPGLLGLAGPDMACRALFLMSYVTTHYTCQWLCQNVQSPYCGQWGWAGTRYTMVSTWCPPPPGPCLTDGHIMVAANRDNYHHKTKNIPPTQSQSQNRNYFVSVRLSSGHDKLHVIHITTSHHYSDTGDNSPRYCQIFHHVCLRPPSYPLS